MITLLLMQIPVVIGVVMSIIFLIVFSGWFAQLVSGWNEYVIDDELFRYRMVLATAVSIVIICGTFFGMAYAIECPNEKREGVFESLNCPDYRNIKTEAESFFGKNTNQTNIIPR